jgi:hypothetical protein
MGKLGATCRGGLGTAAAVFCRAPLRTHRRDNDLGIQHPQVLLRVLSSLISGILAVLTLNRKLILLFANDWVFGGLIVLQRQNCRYPASTV